MPSLVQTSKLWPEHLGIGKPFEVDERLADFTLAYIHYGMDNPEEAQNALRKVVAYQDDKGDFYGVDFALRLKAQEKLDNKTALMKDIKLANQRSQTDLGTKIALVLYENGKLSPELKNHGTNTHKFALLQFLTNQL